MLYGTWLQSARAREREAGVDHRDLACYANLLTSYVQEHLSQALYRLEKLYIRVPPTALNEEHQRSLWETLRPDLIRDVREATDHIAAVLAAVGCTEEELEWCLNAPPSEESSETLENEGETEHTNSGSGDAEHTDEAVTQPVPVVASPEGHESEK